jgi:hypothetical protein
MRRFNSWPILALFCFGLMPFASTAFAQQGTFIPTGSMNYARDLHTVTQNPKMRQF